MEGFTVVLLASSVTVFAVATNSSITNLLPNNNQSNEFSLPFDSVQENYFNITEWSLALSGNHPHTYLNAIEIVRLHEYDAEVHTVQTEDGYILEMHRIPGSKRSPKSDGKPVVLLQHGILTSSADWVIAGPERGFAFLLADAGYDVWMGNARGNVYSRQHKTLKADENLKYWSFSWHEMGIHDLPAMIDHALNVSDQKKLYYVGHSQGSTSFFVMLSELPRYSEKIRGMFSLAPVAYCSHMSSPIFQFMAQIVKPVKLLTALIGVNEFKPTDDFFVEFTSLWCRENIITQPICKNILFMIGGFNNAQMDLALLPAILSHVPAGSSVNQFVHYGQIIKSGHFRQIDLGWYGNLVKYGTTQPRPYNLKNVKVPVALHYSVNDLISSPTDVMKLYSKLPKLIGKFRVPDDRFTHLDYTYAKDAKTLLYDKIMSIMLRYND